MGAGPSRLLRDPGGQHGKAFLRPVLHQEHLHRTGPADLVSDDKDLAARQRRTMSGRILEFIFWGALFLVFYTYFLYPCLLFIAYCIVQLKRDVLYLHGRRDRRATANQSEPPAVSIVIAAFNEEDCLPEKLKNLRQIDYPKDRLEIIFVSDGSTDRTN